ncbi:MAG: hypothetical protein M1823_004215 [Watsoniomyces obsoletus]|nr:MAG: hypothetical protein M1823_004215 [Watsoniomyces obsoletus]
MSVSTFFHACSFPVPDASASTSFPHSLGQHAGVSPGVTPAPFRLLAFGDPQLEGDSSLDPSETSSSFRFFDLPWISISFASLRKRIDLVGNDYYLGHIYRILHWWSDPTHVTVLGDLLGSQWITDIEFDLRASRFWGRVFRGAHRVEDEITGRDTHEVLGQDTKWRRRVINIVGNHDIGYAGDMTVPRIERFESAFGKANWIIRFRVPLGENNTLSSEPSGAAEEERDEKGPELRIVILNSLNLDGPVLDSDLQGRTYDFLNHVILSSKPVEDQRAATVLLTHLPLPKQAGVCVDGPLVEYNNDMYGLGIKEQNHLMNQSGDAILEGIFGMSGDSTAPNRGMGRPGIILTGHDHEGCDVYHHISSTIPENDKEDSDTKSESRRWNATRWSHAADFVQDESMPGIREVTLRSMMGEFGGNAYLLSAWFDQTAEQWHFEVSTCSLGVQHIWWIIHIMDLIALVGVAAFGFATLLDTLGKSEKIRTQLPKKKNRRGSNAESNQDIFSNTTALDNNGKRRLQERKVKRSMTGRGALG